MIQRLEKKSITVTDSIWRTLTNLLHTQRKLDIQYCDDDIIIYVYYYTKFKIHWTPLIRLTLEPAYSES